MTTSSFMDEVRASVDREDSRIQARMTEIMKSAVPKKSKGSSEASATPSWLEPMPPKPGTEVPAKAAPGKRARKPGPKARPPKGSDESWKLAIETVTRQQAEE